MVVPRQEDSVIVHERVSHGTKAWCISDVLEAGPCGDIFNDCREFAQALEPVEELVRPRGVLHTCMYTRISLQIPMA